MNVLQLYDFSRRWRKWILILLALLTIGMIFIVANAHFSEDITDFFAVEGSERESFDLFMASAGSDELIFMTPVNGDLPSAENKAEKIYAMVRDVLESQGIVPEINYHSDIGELNARLEELYVMAPCFADYGARARVYSLISNQEALDEHLTKTLRMSALPGMGQQVRSKLQNDPFGLMDEAINSLAEAKIPDNILNINGYYYTSDTSYILLTAKSPFGGADSGENGMLISELQKSITQTPELSEVIITGAPAIAAGNAKTLKTDSLWSLIAAVALIVLIQIYVFRNFQDLFVIILTLAWGWLFAATIVSMVYNSMSIIVLAMASIVLGIAVNYPLHLLERTRSLGNTKTAFGEVAKPLIIGNLTTVAAFLALVFLHSPSIKALGLFGALMLAATILFVLFAIPAIIPPVYYNPSANKQKEDFITKISKFNMPDGVKKYIVMTVVALTAVFGYYSLDTQFNANPSEINYMTSTQKEAMKTLSGKNAANQSATLFIGSIGTTSQQAISDFAKADNVRKLDSIFKLPYFQSVDMPVAISSPWLKDSATLAENFLAWQKFSANEGPKIEMALKSSAVRLGLKPGIFDQYIASLRGNTITIQPDSLWLYTSGALGGRLATLGKDNNRKAWVLTASGEPQIIDSLKKTIYREIPTFTLADAAHSVEGMTSALSNDFNLAGWLCGFAVFAFLWLTLRSLRLAITAFAPMVIGWIWILGVMSIIGLKFNIITIILATFIFGQGDDYSIFVTEGLVQSRLSGRNVNYQYRRGVIVSALLMFSCMSVLIFATHPALNSLGVVSVLGMFIVVIMAWIVPPMVFKLMYREYKRGDS